MARKGEPVKYTCPDIDKIIATITSMVKGMDVCDERDDKEDLLVWIKNWSSELTAIGVGNNCEMEALRSSNSALRDWGNEMYNDAEALETEKIDLENKCENLQDEIADLKQEIEDLQNERDNQ